MALQTLLQLSVSGENAQQEAFAMHTSRLSPIAHTIDAEYVSYYSLTLFRQVQGVELAGRACRVRVAKIEVKT
jgi:hypothetical protein